MLNNEAYRTQFLTLILIHLPASILNLFAVSRKKHLKPQEQEIYDTIASLRRTVRRITARRNNLTQRLHEAERLLKNKSFDTLDKMATPAKDFFLSYLRNMGKNKYKETYTSEDKAFALALYKKSPRAYRYMA